MYLHLYFKYFFWLGTCTFNKYFTQHWLFPVVNLLKHVVTVVVFFLLLFLKHWHFTR